MKIIQHSDEDLKRWPVGSRQRCGQYTARQRGCGTVFEIEAREDWYSETMWPPPGYGDRPYQNYYARCPNCGERVYIAKDDTIPLDDRH